MVWGPVRGFRALRFYILKQRGAHCVVLALPPGKHGVFLVSPTGLLVVSCWSAVQPLTIKPAYSLVKDLLKRYSNMTCLP